MALTEARPATASVALTAEEIVEHSRRYTMFDWSVQSRIQPMAVDHAKGVYFHCTDGRRFLDFNSQLMSVNIGHGDERVIEAIAEQARRLPYITPFMAHESRARLGKKLAELLPGDINKTFFTLGGSEANEHAIKIARMFTGRSKVLALYRSYHGATGTAISLTGDPRRWAADTAPGIVHVLGPHHWPGQPVETAEAALARLEETIALEGPSQIAAFILEPVVGTNGILIPPSGYLAGVRELCSRHGILMIADEVMTGFGRTGEWFGVNHWNVVPDLITLAKGLTSSYIPMGAVGLNDAIADYFQNHPFATGLTYNSHPIACAAALATITVYEQDDLIANARRLGEQMSAHHARLAGRHARIGAHRNIGLLGQFELFEDAAHTQPLAPFNGTSEAMQKLEGELLKRGLFTMTRWHAVMTNPPLCITKEELANGFGIIDEALEVLD